MVMVLSTFNIERVTWPQGKAFAFTIFDDTDGGTVANTAPIYDMFNELGMRITKSVWPLASPGAPLGRGDTCESPDYLAWVKKLQSQGHEIGYHHASCLTSSRARTIDGIEEFRRLFGRPIVGANHYDNMESIYWGPARLSGGARWLYKLLTRFKSLHYDGHVPGSPRFWGDICRKELSYFRNFVYSDINTLKKCPYMPYEDPSRPFVRAWYASSDGGSGDRFCRLISPENQERLEREGGCCIVYTHLARGFERGGVVRQDFRERMSLLAKRNGWFVPVGQVLDHLQVQHGGVLELTSNQRRRLQWTWLWDKVFLGST
jgi:hypothetical protein